MCSKTEHIAFERVLGVQNCCMHTVGLWITELMIGGSNIN